jgi:hypothetical protein
MIFVDIIKGRSYFLLLTMRCYGKDSNGKQIRRLASNNGKHSTNPDRY